MSKRLAKFERHPRDFYRTPYDAVTPLLPHLFFDGVERFCEPCAGDGALVDHLTKHGLICARARDIEPRRADIEQKDALTTLTGNIDAFISNPPWRRDILHPLIEFLSDQHPTWLLFDADWMHTRQSAEHIKRCRKIVSVGRVSWMGNGVSGFDNCCWYLFDRKTDRAPEFWGRA